VNAATDYILADALFAAARRPEVIAAIRELYAEVDREVAGQSPTCWNKGACCRFGEYGHRLYVTSLEVAYYLAAGGPAPRVTGNVCPHAWDGKCHARDCRPLGCRIFYCDPNAQHWQGPLTEKFLARLRKLHQQFDVPYVYADWITMLKNVSG
jgi:hypothetical protein